MPRSPTGLPRARNSSGDSQISPTQLSSREVVRQCVIHLVDMLPPTRAGRGRLELQGLANHVPGNQPPQHVHVRAVQYAQDPRAQRHAAQGQALAVITGTQPKRSTVYWTNLLNKKKYNFFLDRGTVEDLKWTDDSGRDFMGFLAACCIHLYSRDDRSHRVYYR
jgi:hypothetical protein